MPTKCVYGVEMPIFGYDSVLDCESRFGSYSPGGPGDTATEDTIICCTHQCNRHAICTPETRAACPQYKAASVPNAFPPAGKKKSIDETTSNLAIGNDQAVGDWVTGGTNHVISSAPSSLWTDYVTSIEPSPLGTISSQGEDDNG